MVSEPGIYRTAMDYYEGESMLSNPFEVEIRPWRKDSNYVRVKSTDGTVQAAINSLMVWGIYDGWNLYLNARRMEFGEGYIRVRIQGQYCYFIAHPEPTASQRERVARNTLWFGLLGGIITSAKAKKENRPRSHNLVNLKTGVVNTLSVEYMNVILKEHERIWKEYQNEVNKSDVGVMLQYVEMLNKQLILLAR